MSLFNILCELLRSGRKFSKQTKFVVINGGLITSELELEFDFEFGAIVLNKIKTSKYFHPFEENNFGTINENPVSTAEIENITVLTADNVVENIIMTDGKSLAYHLGAHGFIVSVSH